MGVAPYFKTTSKKIAATNTTPTNALLEKEGAVDRGDLEPRGAAMFVNQRPRDQREARVKHTAQMRRPAERGEDREHRPVQPLRPREAARDAEPHDERAQPFAAIECMILRRIDDVETRHPEQHGEREDERGESKFPTHREPRADRRNREREAEEEVAG